MMPPTRAAIPRLPSTFLVRKRVHALLDTAASVTVVRAVQGFGKTALLASWLERQDPNVIPIWVSLTEDLSDRQQFAHYLERRMTAAGILLATDSPAPALIELDEALLSLGPEKKVVLVLDNISYLQDPKLATDLVILAERHRNLQLMLSTRSAHPIENVAAAKVPITTIDAADLALRVDEIEELSRLMNVALSERAARDLYTQTGGWVAPVRLSILATRNQLRAEPIVRQYLQNLATEPNREQDVISTLRRFSLAHQIDIELVRDLSLMSPIAAEDPVQTLERSGLVDRRQVNGRDQFVLPTLLQEFLRQTMESDATETRMFHRSLADWYSSRSGDDFAFLAFHHAVAGGDIERAHTLWGEHILMMKLTRPELVTGTIGALEHEDLERFPGMAVSAAVARVIATDNDADARTATLRVLAESSARVIVGGMDALPLPDLLYVGTGHLIGLRSSGTLDEALALTAELAERAHQLRRTQEPRDALWSWFQLQWGLTLTLAGKHDEAITHYQHAWEHAPRTSGSHAAANAAANLMMTFSFTGETTRAQLWAQRFSEQEHPSYTSRLASVGAHIAEGMRALDLLDEPTARKKLAALGDGSGAFELWPFVLYLKAQFGLHFDNPRVTLSVVNAIARSHPPAGSSGKALIARATADLLMAAGDGQHARRILDGYGHTDSRVAVSWARLARLSGDPAGARSIAAELFKARILNPRDQLELLIIDGMAALQLGRVTEATVQLSSADTLMKETGIRRAVQGLTDADRTILATVDPHLLAGPARPIYPSTLVVVDLTKREHQLLEALAHTGSRDEIARELYLSVNTVKTHLASVYRKLSATSHGEALAKARQLGLIR
jgi:LuxR family maltose regulon positive regulatory protein